jgi:hypothetical protein
MESAIWKALGPYERRFIDAIMIAHVRAGGSENGRLILTHEQLKEQLIVGGRITSVIQSLVDYGLLEVTHKGGRTSPSRYRVSFLGHCTIESSGRIAHYPPTNDWIKIELEIIDGKRVAREKRHKPPKPREPLIIVKAGRILAKSEPAQKSDPVG